VSKRIEVEHLNVHYGKFKAVEDVSMVIEPRTVTAFIGPSGCWTGSTGSSPPAPTSW